uniref:Putative LAGLIDADG homing endonuclease n=1 Tax=Tydemania expeditionis TaxID=325645 RepID=A0A0D6E208_TYDEX|nr:putative LAGLIDADG homing endonuclease [Tydemania expeditionis]CEO91073.1 putative LAGLIDADG homing endonuclease [Tydemania expeditionis]
MKMILKNIPEKHGYYITGFADGEGSFNVSFRKRNNFLIRWKITPVFNISQDEREILAWIKHILKCGDKVWVFEVTNQQALNEQILPFFDRFPFQSKKKNFINLKRFVNQILMRRFNKFLFGEMK